MNKRDWTPKQHELYKRARKVYLADLVEVIALARSDPYAATDVVDAAAFYRDAWWWCYNAAARSPLPIGLERVARVLAVTSPRKRWAENMRVTRMYFEGVPIAKLPLTDERKAAVWQAVYVGTINDSATKTKSFYRNIVGAYDRQRAVTIDRHMIRPVFGDDKISVSPREYEVLAEAVRSVYRSKKSKDYFHYRNPSEIQAVLWWWYREGRKHYVKGLDK